ncbi:MAG: hypothetical protein P4M09_26645 [Devosia sp.]|nr:hypothetical protein [Devosia sp.]
MWTRNEGRFQPVAMRVWAIIGFTVATLLGLAVCRWGLAVTGPGVAMGIVAMQVLTMKIVRPDTAPRRLPVRADTASRRSPRG